MKEELREIYCYPNYYASNFGNIYSMRSGNLVKLKQFEKRGYLFCKVTTKRGTRRYKGVHRLVALAFVPGRKRGLEVNHINKDRKDNRPCNLEWVTHTENVRYSRGLPLTVITKSGVNFNIPVLEILNGMRDGVQEEYNNIEGYTIHIAKS